MREHVAMVTDKEGVWHVGKFLAVLFCQINWGGELVSNDIVHVVSPT